MYLHVHCTAFYSPATEALINNNNNNMDAVKLITNDYDTFTPGDINRSIASLCSNKACGIDVIFAEHLLHASPDIHVLLYICFNAFIVHGFCLIP